MRILTFTTLFPSSVDPVQGIFVYQRISSFAEHTGADIEVISPVPYMPHIQRRLKSRRWSQPQVAGDEFVGKIHVHHPRYPMLPRISMPMHGMLMFLGARRLALKLHQANPFDCIDAHYVYPDGFAAVMLGRMLRLPVVVSARGTDINLFPSFLTIRPMIRWTLQHCHGIISVSSALKKLMVELGTPADKIEVIGNGVDTRRFRMMERKCARKRLQIEEDGPVLVCVASLREAKGQQHLIAAVGKIASRHPGLKLYLIGEGPYRKNLEDLRQQLGVQEQVVLAGSRENEEIPLWFNAADVSLLPSMREGWPNVVSESLACGTPVIASPVGEIPEILAGDDLGSTVEPDPDLLANAIEASLLKSWDRQAISRYACRRPWTQVAAELEAYFSRILH